MTEYIRYPGEGWPDCEDGNPDHSMLARTYRAADTYLLIVHDRLGIDPHTGERLGPDQYEAANLPRPQRWLTLPLAAQTVASRLTGHTSERRGGNLLSVLNAVEERAPAGHPHPQQNHAMAYAIAVAEQFRIGLNGDLWATDMPIGEVVDWAVGLFADALAMLAVPQALTSGEAATRDVRGERADYAAKILPAAGRWPDVIACQLAARMVAAVERTGMPSRRVAEALGIDPRTLRRMMSRGDGLIGDDPIFARIAAIA